jgi:hypothetical protein
MLLAGVGMEQIILDKADMVVAGAGENECFEFTAMFDCMGALSTKYVLVLLLLYCFILLATAIFTPAHEQSASCFITTFWCKQRAIIIY